MTEQLISSVDEFVGKWRAAEGGEASAAQSQFNDLCAVLGVETPSEADAAGRGADYCFEKRTADRKAADVWKRNHFAWEYKSPGKSLDEALFQINTRYRDALGNPPILIASDLKRFRIRTNFTGTHPREIDFSLKDFADNPDHFLKILRDAFLDPQALHPDNDPRHITERAASRIGEVADALRQRDGRDPGVVARFLIRLIFCMFAEGVDLFRPDGPSPAAAPRERRRPLRDVLHHLRLHPEHSQETIADLFDAMARPDRGTWGSIIIPWFNGGLFDDSAKREILRLSGDLLLILEEVDALDWSKIDPAIMGALFERGLNPAMRSARGAHYTDADSIMRVVRPVIVDPLRREFDELKRACAEEAGDRAVGEPPASPYNGSLPLEHEALGEPQRLALAFHQRLANVRVLDPACGSGNFLYIALRELKQLEQEFLDWAAAELQLGMLGRRVGPGNMLGIDIDEFAVDLTRASLWIGEIQWVQERTAEYTRRPILGSTSQIECRDALLEQDVFGNPQPKPAEWPEAEFIIGNPPFLGGKRMPDELGSEYLGVLRECWEDAVPGGADLSVYWHEQARRQIAAGQSHRAGLLATQNVRGARTRPVLARIQATGAIFFAHQNEPWIGDGAAVRISIIGQDDGSETDRQLNGAAVEHINPDLTTGSDLGSAKIIASSQRLSFRGGERNGPFDIDSNTAEELLQSSGNPNGRPNSDVIFPFVRASDLAGVPSNRSIIDFTGCSEAEAADYAAPFEYLRREVKPKRDASPNDRLREQWWLHGQSGPALRTAIADLSRWIATPVTSKHRFFVWQDVSTVYDNTVLIIARDDAYAFGVLSSKPHTLWALATGTRIGQGNDPRYVHGSTFNAFPFPWPLDVPEEDLDDAQREHHATISRTAKDFHEARAKWLAADSGRTVTELYNNMPTWFKNRQRALDKSVLKAYGWPQDTSDDEILKRLLALNLERTDEGG